MQKRVDGLLLLCTETHQPSKEIIQRYPSIPTVMMDWAPFDGTSDLIGITRCWVAIWRPSI